jgi:hypothetical protein
MSLIRQAQGFAYFGVVCRWAHQIKACPGVAFSCCLEKRSDTRKVQYARCNLGKLSKYLLCSIPEITSKHQCVSFLPAEHTVLPKSN